MVLVRFISVIRLLIQLISKVVLVVLPEYVTISSLAGVRLQFLFVQTLPTRSANFRWKFSYSFEELTFYCTRPKQLFSEHFVITRNSLYQVSLLPSATWRSVRWVNSNTALQKIHLGFGKRLTTHSILPTLDIHPVSSLHIFIVSFFYH